MGGFLVKEEEEHATSARPRLRLLAKTGHMAVAESGLRQKRY